MDIKTLTRFIKGVEECDRILYMLYSKHTINTDQDSYSPSTSAREAMVGAMIERKHSLLEQIRKQGIDVEA